jgi:hypothetical protein
MWSFGFPFDHGFICVRYSLPVRYSRLLPFDDLLFRQLFLPPTVRRPPIRRLPPTVRRPPTALSAIFFCPLFLPQTVLRPRTNGSSSTDGPPSADHRSVSRRPLILPTLKKTNDTDNISIRSIEILYFRLGNVRSVIIGASPPIF